MVDTGINPPIIQGVSNMQIKTIMIAAVLAAASAAHAQTQDPAATPGVDKRQEVQQKRIDKGVQSGQLNAKEAGRLERHQTHIANMESKAKADGTVTRNERSRLHHAQDQESQRIHHQKHDRQKAN
jgi:hypothetical protein